MTSVSNARKLAIWHATALISDVLTVMTMDMLLWIALIKYHLQAHQHVTETTPLIDMTDHHLGITAKPGIPTMIIGTDTDLVILEPTPTTPDIEATVIMIPTEAVLGHFINLHAIAPHITEIPAHSTTTVTHHTADPHHGDTSPERTVDQEHTNPAGNITNQHKDHLLVHTEYPGNIMAEDTNMSRSTTLPQNTIAQMNRIVILRMI